MYKVIHVPAYYAPVLKEFTENVPTGETKKGLLGWESDITVKETHYKKVGDSDCCIDGARLATDLEKVANKLVKMNYEVTSVTPVISGEYKFDKNKDSGYGFGYSYTDSLIVLAVKVD